MKVVYIDKKKTTFSFVILSQQQEETSELHRASVFLEGTFSLNIFPLLQFQMQSRKNVEKRSKLNIFPIFCSTTTKHYDLPILSHDEAMSRQEK